MHRICPVFCVFYLLFHGFSNSVIVDDGSDMTVSCDLKQDRMVFWFHIKENGSTEFLASFSNGVKKEGQTDRVFDNTGKTLTVKNFKKHTDSGIYSCVSFNSNKLIFGTGTRLEGKPDPVTEKIPVPVTTKAQEITTPKTTVACLQKNTKAHTNIEASLGCKLHIFIPLLVGSGLLLLLQLIALLYCNRIRTRRCPHHYKRQPRSTPTGHKALPNPPGF